MSNWANEVDKYIEENEIKKGNPENDGSAKFYGFIFTLFFTMCSFGAYLLVRSFFRTPYFHQYIHNRTGHYKVQDVQKKVDFVLEQEATRLKEGEEVLFVITGGGGNSAMVFTQDRLIYTLLAPSKMSMSEISGEIKLTDLGKPTVNRSIVDNSLIGFGGENIGALEDFRNEEMLLEFLRKIKLALG